MATVHGKVVNGRIEVEGVTLEEGTEVIVIFPQLSEEEEAELEEALAKADRGGGIPWEDFQRQLRARRDL